MRDKVSSYPGNFFASHCVIRSMNLGRLNKPLELELELELGPAITLALLKSMLDNWLTRFWPVDFAFLRIPPDFLILVLALAKS